MFSLNVRGLNNVVKRKQMTYYIIKHKPDVVFLQETHLKKAALPVLKSNKFIRQYQAPDTSKALGVAILISNAIRFHCTGIETDPGKIYLY